MSSISMEDYQSERNDSQSDETYTTPISPLSPQEKSPPPTSLPSPPLHSSEQRNETDAVKEMQILIQSSADLTFPLQDSWTFWYFKNDRMCDWKDNLIQITTISTVEAFWSVFNHLQVASRLGQGCDYFLFKNHIVSSLSRATNEGHRKGSLATDVGRRVQSIGWSLVVKLEQESTSERIRSILAKHRRSSTAELHWSHALLQLLSLIGDQYPDAEYVNGCVVSVRSKGDRISLWTRDWRHSDVTKRIG